MQAYLPEKIGNPELFSGRKKELDLFQRWIDGIPRRLSKSRALLSRRKTGKTAIMQRLYNLTFEKHIATACSRRWNMKPCTVTGISD